MHVILGEVRPHHRRTARSARQAQTAAQRRDEDKHILGPGLVIIVERELSRVARLFRLLDLEELAVIDALGLGLDNRPCRIAYMAELAIRLIANSEVFIAHPVAPIKMPCRRALLPWQRAVPDIDQHLPSSERFGWFRERQAGNVAPDHMA